MTDTVVEIKRKKRAARRGGLFINDAELVELLGVPEKQARRMIKSLDKNYRTTGFPQKREMWGKRRFRPAVEKWLELFEAKMQNGRLSA